MQPDGNHICGTDAMYAMYPLYRLVRYDLLHNSTEVLLEKLHFANGVQLSRYEDFVLVVETARACVMKSVYELHISTLMQILCLTFLKC